MYLFHVMHVGLWEITIQNYNVEQTERLSLTDSASSLPAITPMHNQNMLAFTVMLKVLESQYYKYHTVCVCVCARIFFRNARTLWLLTWSTDFIFWSCEELAVGDCTQSVGCSPNQKMGIVEPYLEPVNSQSSSCFSRYLYESNQTR